MSTEHHDVLIVGAGLSGIGAGCRLRQQLPDLTFAILESREAIGGTWDLFRYPGIRSDSDMFTLGYDFQPWEEAEAIADGPSILEYVRRTAREYRVDEQVRFGHRVVAAAFSRTDARWTVTVERTAPDGSTETVEMTCGFLYCCTGYYRYDEGYTPEFPGRERFTGTVVHPQHWPEDLNVTGKRVVVIGSGATAVTLVPALARDAAHVTMLQRSPSYVVSAPARDPLAGVAQRFLPRPVAYTALRWKNLAISSGLYNLSRRAPGFTRSLIRKGTERQLPPEVDVDTHFRPRYDPWDERLCLVPNGDLFRALRHGSASVRTDRIETFTETGLRLESGETLDADVVVTATGLNLLLLGGMDLSVDGEAVDLSTTVGYKGLMFSGVPNLAATLGYTNASWTLKADLVSRYVCRVLRHMQEQDRPIVVPDAPDPERPTEPFINLQSGYVLRALDRLPRQGDRTPWRLHQSYPRDIRMLRMGAIEDGALRFERAGERVPAA